MLRGCSAAPALHGAAGVGEALGGGREAGAQAEHVLVFGGGCALAGLAGVIGGNAFVTEPGMAAAVGSIVFVVVVFGGMGSLTGAFIASLLFGAIQTFAVALDWSLVDGLKHLGVNLQGTSGFLKELTSITIAQAAPVLPYLMMVLMLIVRPTGLMGTRET